MHKILREAFRLLATVSVVVSTPVWPALVIPGADGTDGDFAPAANVVIDLSLAPTAAWDSPGSGDGVYDPDKWAVVFKYSSVDIPPGVTVSFTNHNSRAPVVWLVSGDVNIDGVLNLNGQAYQTSGAYYAEPGPGGFSGGMGYRLADYPSAGGQGIGGGAQSNSGGSHATAGVNNSFPLYGNRRVLPLVGGSGGGGDVDAGVSGGGGGGALLLAAGGVLTVNGAITARGGAGVSTGFSSYWATGSGAGGALRLTAETIAGSGGMYAIGGSVNTGGMGRIRIEAINALAAWDVYPATTVVSPDDPVLLWLPTDAPTAEVTSIATELVPADPHARIDPGQEDITLPLLGGDADILVQTTNVDTLAGTVQVRITPKNGAPVLVDAVFDSGTLEQATWVATATLPVGYFTVQAHAVNPAP